MDKEKQDILTAEEFIFIRKKVDMTLREMAAWLGKPGPYAERTIRRWERGLNPVPPYVRKLFNLAGYTKYLSKMNKANK